MAAVIGLLVLLAGLIGAAVLFLGAQRRPEDAVGEFARAPVGCTTTLEFTDTGTFYVFEERAETPAAPLGDCEPVADPNQSFGFVLSSDGDPVDGVDDVDLIYEFDGRSGQSVRSFEVDEPTRFEIEVVGDDLTVVAAIGRDPDESVAALQRAAIAVAGLGVLLGGALLLLAGRRSRRAAEVTPPIRAGVWERPADFEQLPDDRPLARLPVPSADPSPDLVVPSTPVRASVSDESDVPDEAAPPPPTSPPPISPPVPPPPPTTMPRPLPGTSPASPWGPPAVERRADPPADV